MLADVDVKCLIFNEAGVAQGLYLPEVVLHLRNLLLLHHEELDCELLLVVTLHAAVEKPVGSLPYFLFEFELLLEDVGTAIDGVLGNLLF